MTFVKTTRYGSEFKPRWQRDLPHPPGQAPIPPNLMYDWYRLSWPGVTGPVRGVDRPVIGV